MEFKTTNIKGLIVIKPKKFRDKRGFFLESFQKKNYIKIIGNHVFVQDNFSKSKKNVIRGLHYQLKNSQDKLIYVTHGELINVVVDLRKSSPSFLCKFKIKLSDYNNLQLFKCEMESGHSGRSGRTAAIEEVAFDYAFALKISGKL